MNLLLLFLNSCQVKNRTKQKTKKTPEIKSITLNKLSHYFVTCLFFFNELAVKTLSSLPILKFPLKMKVLLETLIVSKMN